jgi:GNAT superfamily N-acetyltransferase
MLQAYDAEYRTMEPVAREGVTIERDGPVWRTTGPRGGSIKYPRLDGLAGDELRGLIERQRDHFAALGQRVEWVTYAHDEPTGLPEILIGAGFTVYERGTVLIGRSVELAGPDQAVDGVEIREVSGGNDFQRIAEMQSAAWDEDNSWLAGALAAQQAALPGKWTFLVAEAGGEVVSAAWIGYLTTRFGGLFGGATLPAWRGRGIYRALVTRRARLAHERGHELLVVDASAHSRPILRRLGLTPVTTRITYSREV